MSALMLPWSLLATAGTFFETCGIDGLEGTALVKTGPDGPSLVVPDQLPCRGPSGGVSVEVTQVGQMQLATALGQDELYVARIHSHPAEAFHSAADDENPVLTHEGALSIVAPFFGLGLRHGLDVCAVLRLHRGRWTDLPAGPERVRWVWTDGGPGR